MIDVYQKVDKNLLGYAGKLYPMDMQIEIRAASVPEIRAWSNMNEDDPQSMASHIIDIIVACTRVTSSIPGKSYSPKDLYEHDKLALLLMIHGATFADQKHNNIFVSGECTNAGCGKQFEKLAISPANLQYNCPDEKYEQYIDADKGCFVMQTKSYGTIEYKPSTIGLGSAMMSWISTFKPQFIRDNQSMFAIVQALVTDWRLANDKTLRRIQIEHYNQMDGNKLGFYLSLIDKLSVTLSNELEYVCPQCGNTFRCELAINGGYKQMFVPVQSLDDELL